MRPLRATYRLQLTPSFGFAEAERRIPYLRDLGISHLYLSPSLQARAGSQHGYDVVDPTTLSADLGGQAAFRSLVAAAHGAGLGIVLDIVPNHMAVDDANRFWTDPALRARFFDIDPETGRHRRFFDIDDLAGVRQEDPSVFDETHALVLSLVREGMIDALRIDHPDGMRDPAGYLARLRDGGADTVWVEKILEPSERLRDWPVAGTVGYEFLNDVCAVFVDPHAAARLTALWVSVSGDPRGFDEIALQAKREQAAGPFAPELDRLARALDGAGETPDQTISIESLREAVAKLPIYRTYVDPDANTVADADREAIAAARIEPELASRLLLDTPAPAEFVWRYQQTTPAVVAKGIEDTAFYRYAPLLALNDVGGSPDRFGLAVDDFHAACLERARRFPRAMLTTMTHDTKRSADARARLAALSWIGEEWERHVRRWLASTESLRSVAGAPDVVERYFLLQTLAGVWPIERDRVQEYMLKALREAKRNTSWIDVDVVWETGVRTFIDGLYDDFEFRSEFEPFVTRLAFLGERVSLGMVALKLTCPGIPDIYQGDELPTFSLVDPDNRRPVDWEWREAMAGRLVGGASPHTEPGLRKLALTRALLGLRIRRPAAFAADGGYEPLDAGDDALAFTRGGEVLVCVGVRHDAPTGSLPPLPGVWRDLLGGARRSLDGGLALARVL
ncbi:MAG: malto-oligosyltrehalose synthase, partial [Solirubrobacteraceae bacterium]